PVHRVEAAGVAHARLHQRHVAVAVVLVVEARAGLARIHDADLDHDVSMRLMSGRSCRSGAAAARAVPPPQAMRMPRFGSPSMWPSITSPRTTGPTFSGVPL